MWRQEKLLQVAFLTAAVTDALADDGLINLPDPPAAPHGT